MIRPHDQVRDQVDTSFWEYVEKMDDGRMRCKFCGHLFAKGTPITRIRFHLAGVTGRGVRSCGQVPQHVQDAALAAIDGPPAKKPKPLGGSSNNDVPNEISASAQQQNNEMVMAQRRENTAEGSIQHVNRSVSPWRHTIGENDNRREATESLVQPGVGASSSGGNVNHNAISTSTPQEQNNEVDNLTGDGTRLQAPDMYEKRWEEILNFLENDDIENGIGGVAQPGAGARFSVGLKHNPSETRGAPLPTGSTKLVGRAFEENKNVIWSWLMDDEVSIIGIYGMGGAGKTTMLKDIYNELLQIADISHHVYWVTVSQDFSIQKLQKKIAKRIKLSLSNEEEELHIAAELSLELEKKQRWILILDDLWDSFELHEVGIPVPLKGCKLIMTTRSKEICGRMDCRNNIIVNPIKRIAGYRGVDRETYDRFTNAQPNSRDLFQPFSEVSKSVNLIAM